MNNPQMTFKNVQQLIQMGYGSKLPSNKNKMPNWLTILINFTIVATLIMGTIYTFNLI